MNTLTLADVYASRLPGRVGACPGPDLLALINDAVERLLNSGKWWGTCAEIRICATDGCITLPRQIVSIERAAMCRLPIPVHDFWFQFLRNGIGLRNDKCGPPECNSVGQFPAFSPIFGSMSKLKFICDVPEDVGQNVLVLGYNGNNWIRTRQGGNWADGELIPLAQGAGTISQNVFTQVTGIQFPKVMQGQSWLYEYAANATSRMIGQYDNDNIRPNFARYRFPSINPQSLNKDSSGNAIPIPIDIIGKLAFIPVAQPTDYLQIGCLPALIEMCMALKKSGTASDGVTSNKILMSGMATAKSFLDDELTHHLGDGREVGVEIQGSLLADALPVQNFI